MNIKPVEVNLKEEKRKQNIVLIARGKKTREVVFEGMTIEELGEKLEKSLGSDLRGEGLNIAQLSLQHNVNPYLGLAIILHETGCSYSCSYLSRACHNYGGQKGSPNCMGSYQGFASKEEGLKAFYSNLSNNYINKGLHTAKEINTIYAENPLWHITIEKYTEKIKNR